MLGLGLHFMQAVSVEQHGYNATLSIPLVLRDGLCVQVHRHNAVGMPQEFLHRLHVLTVGLEECRVGAPEGVPANPLDTKDFWLLAECAPDKNAPGQYGKRPLECGLAKTQSSGRG